MGIKRVLHTSEGQGRSVLYVVDSGARPDVRFKQESDFIRRIDLSTERDAVNVVDWHTPCLANERLAKDLTDPLKLSKAIVICAMACDAQQQFLYFATPTLIYRMDLHTQKAEHASVRQYRGHMLRAVWLAAGRHPQRRIRR